MQRIIEDLLATRVELEEAIVVIGLWLTYSVDDEWCRTLLAELVERLDVWSEVG